MPSESPEARLGLTEGTADPWRHRRPVILVAEDDAADQELLLRALRRLPEQCDIHIVADGVELLDYLTDVPDSARGESRPPPDWMIIDLKMPRKDGRQVLREITYKLKLTTPVVIFSTSDDARDIRECYEAGCNSYVTKPIDLHRFNEVVHLMAAYWLRLSRMPLASSRV